MGAKMPEEEMQPLVDAWRAANPHIVQFWYALGNAASEVIEKRNSVRVGKVKVYWQENRMLIRLPGGRDLCYLSPRFVTNRFGSRGIGYLAAGASGKMELQETFGGKIAENCLAEGIESQNISFAVHTIRPWLVRIEQAINKTLIPENEKGRYYAQFNIDGLMRGDYKSRMEGYAIARQNGWMSANDIRALENLNPISEEEGGNAYLVNGNMIPISLAGLGVLLGLAAQSEEEPAEETTSAKEEGEENGETTDAGQPV